MFKKAKSNGFGSRTIFSNTVENTFNPVKKFAAFVVVDGDTKIFTYEGKFRSEVTAYFEEEARLNQAEFDGKIYPVN
jgi:hypothetical protein